MVPDGFERRRAKVSGVASGDASGVASGGRGRSDHRERVVDGVRARGRRRARTCAFASSDQWWSRLSGKGVEEAGCELFFPTTTKRAKKREKFLSSRHIGGGESSVESSWHPGRVRRSRGVSSRAREARVNACAGRRTLRNATVPSRSTSLTVPCLVDASPRVMTTSCPSKDWGSRGANRQKPPGKAFARVPSPARRRKGELR